MIYYLPLYILEFIFSFLIILWFYLFLGKKYIFFHELINKINKKWYLVASSYLLLSVFAITPVIMANWQNITDLFWSSKSYTRPLKNPKLTNKVIYLIHGWKSNAELSWRDMKPLLIQDKRLKCVNIYAANYPGYLSRNVLPINELTTSLLDDIEFLQEQVFTENGYEYNIENRKKTEVIIIGHSLGGVLGRSIFLQTFNKKKYNKTSIKHLITIGAPFDGVKDNLNNIMSGVKVLGFLNFLNNKKFNDSLPYWNDLKKGSDFIKSLQFKWNNLDSSNHVNQTCFYSINDEVVNKYSAIKGCKKSNVIAFKDYTHTELQHPVDKYDPRWVKISNILAKTANCKAIK